jgi:hypothetical protein
MCHIISSKDSAVDFAWTILYPGLAVIALLGWLWKRWKTRGHPHWPMAEGTVESYRAEEGRHSVTWFIVYSYSANGEYYSGEFGAQLPWMSATFRSEDTVEEMVKQSYPRETKFPLRYNPEEPQWSVPSSRKPLASRLIAHT